MLELVRAGTIAPSAEAVAAHAGVGVRTVFRLFQDTESLYRAMQAAMLRRLAPILDEALPEGPPGALLDAMIARRARLFEELMPIKTAADAQRWRSPFLQADHRMLVDGLRARMLAALADAPGLGVEAIEALDAALSFEVWRRLRVDQGLDPARARVVMARLARGVLDQPAGR